MTNEELRDTFEWLKDEPDKAELCDRACKEWPRTIIALLAARETIAELVRFYEKNRIANQK